jgi:hypothetical protein
MKQCLLILAIGLDLLLVVVGMMGWLACSLGNKYLLWVCPLVLSVFLLS